MHMNFNFHRRRCSRETARNVGDILLPHLGGSPQEFQVVEILFLIWSVSYPIDILGSSFFSDSIHLHPPPSLLAQGRRGHFLRHGVALGGQARQQP